MRYGRRLLLAVVIVLALPASAAAEAGSGLPAGDQATPGQEALEGARLALTVTGVPRSLRRNRWAKLKVTLSNPGDRAARNVRLRIGKARGLRVRPRTRAYRSIGAGKHKTTTVRVKITRRARRSTRLRLRAKAARGLSAGQRVMLRLGRHTRHRRPKSALAGRYFWGFDMTNMLEGWDDYGIYFVDGRWAYRGIPKGGLPNCTAVTAVEDGQDGCVRYRYDRRSGALTVGGVRGTFEDGKLTIDDERYMPLAIPESGARFDVSLVHRDYSGMCGLIAGCVTWAEWLTLRDDGQFALSSQTVGSMGGGGAPFTAGWSAPPDEHGTYTILSRGRIRLAFADGSVQVKTIAIQLTDAGRPDPSNAGLLVDETNYYKESDQ